MIVYGEVNNYLRHQRYAAPMPKRKRRAPHRTAIDASGFAERLRDAMKARDIINAELARQAGIERATIGKWLSGAAKHVDALPLINVAAVLKVSIVWLLKGGKTVGQPKPLTPDQDYILNVYDLLTPDHRAAWIDNAKTLYSLQAVEQATKANPFPVPPALSELQGSNPRQH